MGITIKQEGICKPASTQDIETMTQEHKGSSHLIPTPPSWKSIPPPLLEAHPLLDDIFLTGGGGWGHYCIFTFNLWKFFEGYRLFSFFQMGKLTLSMGGGGGNYMEWLKIRHKELFFLQNKLRQDNFCPKLLGFPCETYDSLRYAILQEVLIFYKR